MLGKQTLPFGLVLALVVGASFFSASAHDAPQAQESVVSSNELQFVGSEHRNATAHFGYMLFPNGVANRSTVTFANVSTDAFQFVNAKGVNLYSFGDIAATAGDYYGASDRNEVICSGTSVADAQAKFMNIWSNYWGETSQSFVNDIRSIFQQEDNQIDNKAPEIPTYEAIYISYLSYPTGVMKRMLSLALANFDHFGSCASTSYSAIHALAQQMAREAGATLNAQIAYHAYKNESILPSELQAAVNSLTVAYGMDAFAQHFLSDLFAAGHVRTPRMELANVCTSSVSAGLVSMWQHDEDNRNGLWVTNLRGDVWQAFGDDSYFKDQDSMNVQLLAEASQLSRMEVFAAFNGSNANTSAALNIIPNPVLTATMFPLNNTCPLFKIIDNTMMRRDPVGVLRPPLWFSLQGLNQTNNRSSSCTYVPFTRDYCPMTVSETTFRSFITDPSLFWNKASQAWQSTMASTVESPSQPADYSGFLVATIILSIILAIFILALGCVVSCWYSGKCRRFQHQSLKEAQEMLSDSHT